MTSIAKLLVERTDHLHERFDAQYETVLFFDLTKEKYVDFMRKLYGYYIPAEEHMRSVEGKRVPACLLYDQSRVPALKQDLLALGETEETIQQVKLCPDVPQLDTVPQALGYLYILEGSLFGNEPVARQLVESLQIDEHHGSAFFGIVKPQDVRPRWKAFQEMLLKYASAHPEDNEAIIQAAIETILSYESWLFEGKVTHIKRIDSSLHGHSHSHGTHSHGTDSHANTHDHDHNEADEHEAEHEHEHMHD